MIRSLCIAAVIAVFISPAMADTLKAGYPVCISEDLLDQDHVAVAKADIEALTWLASNGCTLTSDGVHVSILGFSDLGLVAHVRAYLGKHAVEVWTDREAVNSSVSQ